MSVIEVSTVDTTDDPTSETEDATKPEARPATSGAAGTQGAAGTSGASRSDASDASDASDDGPDGGPDGGLGTRLSAFTGLLWDVGAPLVGYYALHLLGASDWVALLVATLAAGLRLVWVALRSREITWFAAVMLAVFGLGLALAFVGGDPRFLLLKDSFGTGLVGIVFLASLFFGRPLTFSAFRTWMPTQAAEMEQAYRYIPLVRQSFRFSSAIWGVGLLLEAGARVPLIYTLPIDVMVGVSTAMMVTVIVVLAAWNTAYGARTARRARAWAIAQQTAQETAHETAQQESA